MFAKISTFAKVVNIKYINMHFSTLFNYCPRCGSGSFVNNNVKSKRCESCNFVMYVNASAAVAAFIINTNNELLVCKRAKDPEKGTFDLPGGFVDDNETAEQAVIREIKEELNADVIESAYVFSLPNLYEYSGWTLPTLDLFFVCKLKNYAALKAGDDVESCFFIPIDQINPSQFGLKSIRKGVELFKNQF